MEKIIFDVHSCTLFLGGKKRKLGSKDTLVLEFLCNSGNDGARKNDIIEYAWQGLVVTDASLSKSISTLRSALMELSPGDDIILTVPRVGYKLAPNKISLNIEVMNQLPIIENAESKGEVEEKISKKLHVLFTSVKYSLLISSLIFFILGTKKIILSEGYLNRNFISPSLVKETLSREKEIYYFAGVDKPSFRNVIKKINCECVFIVSSNSQHTFILTYLKKERKALNFIFKKDDDIDMVNYIQAKVNDGVHHD
ncbi:winged helix-turn-helix domain-containing protein [Aeromonas sp. JL9]|uniref:winged helix-turn-helix domain-containing protein n=1 Tax=Aeromonas sp. JL9 TaxID=2950549 RepID=UPI002109DF8A|nr:winged helix-turn-helix domain-containing protein [Aeromonas sp. JL9]MCQ4111571.1 winged helix-turn-helix domain-containing protein [Aeromonas sp. JL9]